VSLTLLELIDERPEGCPVGIGIEGSCFTFPMPTISYFDMNVLPVYSAPEGYCYHWRRASRWGAVVLVSARTDRNAAIRTGMPQVKSVSGTETARAGGHPNAVGRHSRERDDRNGVPSKNRA